MEANEVIKVVEKLIGKIEPVADSAIDAERKENLLKYMAVFDYMHTQMDDIAWRYRDSPYSSQKELADICEKFLNSYDNE